jgi:hypothetical protein
VDRVSVEDEGEGEVVLLAIIAICQLVFRMIHIAPLLTVLERSEFSASAALALTSLVLACLHIRIKVSLFTANFLFAALF